ncbi:hypothetical protein WGH24286_00352 [Periweissella ghanensis]|uniref:DoxX family protein n=1 Tax=Periweissella ghanensis TaxID=467997 RepID=A0ABM8Z9C7_9LACO|nr:DoxX family membrane protein [Periweissella ghanensis]CAH0417936.1 hypothetical protein WGH24286_00352 [Periweissella ghanensis]
MIINFLRTNKVCTALLTIIRVWLGYNWTIDGFQKITSQFSAHGFINNAIAHPVQSPTGFAFPWYTAFLKLMTGNGAHTAMFSFLVSWGELLVGLGLLFGTLTLLAAFFGLFLNFAYLLAGTVSINPTYIILEFIILLGGFNSAKIGLDYWVTPFFRNLIGNRHHGKDLDFNRVMK